MKVKFVWILFVLGGIAPLQARIWTEAATGRTINADFVKVDGDSVVIRLAGGTTTKIAISRLSEADQSFVKEQAAAGKNSPGSADDSKGGDIQREVLGTWKGFMANSDGSPHGEIQLTITEKEITATNPNGGVMGAGSYSIAGGNAKIRRIDAKGTSGQYEGKSYQGIITVEGKTLKWCSANDNPRSERPSKLQTDTQAGQFLMVLEREAP